MRSFLLLLMVGIIGGCAAEKEDDRVMIALVIENELDRHILTTNIEFVPESGIHTFGNIVSGGNRGNLGFPVNAKPTAMELTLHVAKEAGINPMEVDGTTVREVVVRTIELFEPERNRANYPEYHLIVRADGSIEQVRDIEADEAKQREAAAADDDTPSTDDGPAD